MTRRACPGPAWHPLLCACSWAGPVCAATFEAERFCGFALIFALEAQLEEKK